MGKEQLSAQAKSSLEKQQYRIIGSHSAVKTCNWTKSMIRGRGGCYKMKFYGIDSSQCLQMTTSLSCANRCKFCWRDYKSPVSKEWKWDADEPKMIVEESINAHHNLLVGFAGSPSFDRKAYEKSKSVKHVALSLTGEPIAYPRINEVIAEFHSRGISTFLVTNAQYPEAIRELAPVTQLYISLDAPSKEMLKGIDVPLFKDYWERLNKSLGYMAQKKQRTCVRLTMVKGVNMANAEGYAAMIKKGNPDFVEVKAYMHVGASMRRLKRENMPVYEEILEFSKQLNEHLPGYKIVSGHIPSRVVMLAKEEFFIGGKWKTWIDFEKFNKLALAGKNFSSRDYLRETPAKQAPSCSTGF